MIVGSGKFQYQVNADWAKLPEGWSFKEVGGVGVDGNDNVYVFSRGEHPMMVFDRAGNFLRSWGEGQYPRAHGVHTAPDDTMFLTDDGGHFIRKTREIEAGCLSSTSSDNRRTCAFITLIRRDLPYGSPEADDDADRVSAGAELL